MAEFSPGPRALHDLPCAMSEQYTEPIALRQNSTQDGAQAVGSRSPVTADSTMPPAQQFTTGGDRSIRLQVENVTPCLDVERIPLI